MSFALVVFLKVTTANDVVSTAKESKFPLWLTFNFLWWQLCVKSDTDRECTEAS